MSSTVTTENKDSPRPGFVQTVGSYPRSYWFANVIELFERWGYYGLRGGFLSVFMVTAVAQGGLGFNHIQKGSIYAWWALLQSLLPMFTGGYADKYGYKKTVAIAICITCTGYVLMGNLSDYSGFFLASMLVATGTAIFKPGIQGILAHSTNKQNAPLGWSIFYMVVNIGGFVGPLVTGFMRVISWEYVFYLSALMHSLNLLILLAFKEPAAALKQRNTEPFALNQFCRDFITIFLNSIKNLWQWRLLSFLIIFSGFWLMFMQLFDILANFITDWVDTAPLYTFLGNIFNSDALIQKGLAGTQMPAEWLVNMDAAAIIIFMLPIGWTFGRMKAVPAMVLGMTIAAAGIIFAGASMSASICIAGIVVFAVGEMIASPRKNEYLASIAPEGKLGLYMGYVNFPQAIGWGIGSKIGGHLYQNYADKLSLARDYMQTKLNMTHDAVMAIPPENVVSTLSQQLGHVSLNETTVLLFNTYHPQNIWYAFAAVGLVSVVGMFFYNIIVERKRQAE
ncbi:MAG: MFS transporter [Deltaproteobacteria bacterium]|nr:MFS transporter [Deltaproteobacteria bacterium]